MGRRRDVERRRRTELVRADRVKAAGVHYTPPELAAFMASQALDVMGDRTCVRVLDPACGDGELLTAVTRALAGPCHVEVVGCDLDHAALTVAERRVASLARPGLSWSFNKCDFLAESASARHGDGRSFGGLENGTLHEKFDLVIANPPYVRTQVLGSEEARRLAAAFGLSGRVDLYHVFVVAMTEALAESGVLTLLCSNRFMTTRTGTALRRYMRERLSIRRVFDLGDTKLFGAAVLPAVVVATRNEVGGSTAPMTSVYEHGARGHARQLTSLMDGLHQGHTGPVSVNGRSYVIRRGELRLDAGPDQPWVLASESEGWVTEVDAHAAMRFGDVGKVRVGIKTTADPVFVRADWDDLGSDKPEDLLLRPLVTHRVARKWSLADPVHRVLYPYDLMQEKRHPLDLVSWPRARRYLERHRDRLEGRRYVVEAGREWWEIWVPQRPALWAHPKLVFPDISDEPRFALDRSGAVVNGDCYWLSLASDADQLLGLLMMAVANSSLASRYYDSVCGNKLYSGRRRYITQYVERFPIPDPERPESLKVTALTALLVGGSVPESDRSQIESEIDDLVWRSFGIEEIPR